MKRGFEGGMEGKEAGRRIKSEEGETGQEGEAGQEGETGQEGNWGGRHTGTTSQQRCSRGKTLHLFSALAPLAPLRFSQPRPPVACALS